MTSLEGTVLGARYRLGVRLGRGGMGEVYEAVDEAIGRPVAIKVLGDDAHHARFEREARVVARLAHPHIVAVSDFRNAVGEPSFIVMERLVGESLGELLAREKTLAPERVVSIALQTLSALAAAHDAGVVHRDVKPDNVFVCKTDGAEHVKLLDFGIAKAFDATSALTQAGSIVGTIRYMAPEQVLGAPVDARTDVYAMGATMYRALAGACPFSGKAAEILEAIVLRDAPPVECDGGLAAIIACALSKSPDARFPSARAMMNALEDWLRAPSAPAPAPRQAATVAMIAALVVLASGATVFAASLRHAPQPLRAAAPPSATLAAIADTSSSVPIEPLTSPASPSSSSSAPRVTRAIAKPRAATFAAPARPGFTADGALVVGAKLVRVRPVLQSNASALADDVVTAALERSAWYVLLQYHAFDGLDAPPSGTITVAFQVMGTHAVRSTLRATTFADRTFSARAAVMTGATRFPDAPKTAAGDVVVAWVFTVQ